MIIFVRNLVVKDIWLKLFSLGLAIMIWLTVQFSISKDMSPWAALIGRTADETTLNVPVFVLATGARAVSLTPADVQVTVRADPISIKNLRADNIRAQVNLIGVESANGLKRKVEIVLPQGVAFTHIAPEEVEVRVSPTN